MTDSPSCPTRRMIRELLADPSSAADSAHLVKHLEGCKECREEIDASVGQLSAMLTTLRACLADETSKNPSLRQAIEDLLARNPLAAALTDRMERLIDLRISGGVELPTRLGPYEIIKRIGKGGMGVVYLGHDPKLDRDVAIKLMAPRFAHDDVTRKRFYREARAAATIKSPHVVTIYAVEEQDGEPYIVMECIRGQSLRERLEHGPPMSIKEIVEVGIQIAKGLAAAHEKGIIHRDVKPSNILLEEETGQVKITDFGLSRAIAGDDLTQTGELLGTPLYMAPEQTEGLADDPRSDLFSLGSVMYAMCTGRAAFHAATPLAIARRVREESPKPICEIRPSVPAWLAAIVDRLLAKDPAERFQSARDVVASLREHSAQRLASYDQDTPTLSVEATARRKGRHGARRTKRQVVLVALSAVVLLGSLTVTDLMGVTHFGLSIVQIIRGDGTLVVEITDPEVEVSIDGGKVRVSGADAKMIRLRPGLHQVEATRHGVPFRRHTVMVTRRGKTLLRVEWKPNGPILPPTQKSSQRETLAYFLELGARAGIRVGDRVVTITSPMRLPPHGFEVESLSFTDSPHVRNEHLVHLRRFDSLRRLYLTRTHVTDEGLKHVAKLKGLRILAISTTATTDTGLILLEGLQDLVKLDIERTGLTDEGLKHLITLPKLSRLNIKYTKVTDRGIAYLPQMKQLEVLYLAGTAITDQSIDTLGKLKSLRELMLARTKLTKQSIARLQSLLPKCLITLNEKARHW